MWLLAEVLRGARERGFLVWKSWYELPGVPPGSLRRLVRQLLAEEENA